MADGLAGHAVDIGYSAVGHAALQIGWRGHAQLTLLRMSDNQFNSWRTVWQGQSNQH